ncbi:hypothetical protein SDC9_104374 [bioreactor metagenome]|uniref:Uncharacterized protein n=1 Tax=bioreactor metagenome TaxID=1076179 RepID=A0A645AWD2_9ZZZZ
MFGSIVQDPDQFLSVHRIRNDAVLPGSLLRAENACIKPLDQCFEFLVIANTRIIQNLFEVFLEFLCTTLFIRKPFTADVYI